MSTEALDPLSEDDLETISIVARNGQTGRITPYEARSMVSEIIILRSQVARLANLVETKDLANKMLRAQIEMLGEKPCVAPSKATRGEAMTDTVKDVVDNAAYLRDWAADIRKSSGNSVDADKLDSIATEIDDLKRASRNRDMWKGQCERQAEELTRLRSLAGSVPEGWKDISTAPKDGTRFLGYSDRGHTRECLWYLGAWCYISGIGACKRIKLTHWRHLSAPPVASSPVAPVAETVVSSDADDMIDQLNVLCEDFGCEAGSNRLHWLHERLTKLSELEAASQEAQPKVGGLAPGDKAAFDALTTAGDALSFAAQTTGGVAGRDEGLVEAVNGWHSAKDKARQLRRIERFESSNDALPSSSSAERARAIEALTVAHSALEQIRHESDCDDPEFEIIDRRHHQDLETAFQKIVVALRSLKQQENG